MDQREETTEQNKKKRRIQATPSFPPDLVSEILSKLPAKSVGRFRCVSKLWSSITTDAYFINKFETRSTNKKPSLLVTFRRGDRLSVFSIPQDCQSSKPHSISSYHMPYPKHCSFLPKVCVHGLICFANPSKPTICNPTIRKFLTLTKPEKRWKNIVVFLGYDPINAKHKVLCMPFDETLDECSVYTLGSAQESWRKIKTNQKYRLQSYDTNYVCINGVLYYEAYTDQTQIVGNIIMSFDVRSEKFHMIKLPWKNNGRSGILQQYEGKLVCVKSNRPGQGITWWILHDAEKPIWYPKNFLEPLPYYDRVLKIRFNFIGITEAGKLVCIQDGFYKWFYVLYYDPKRSRSHRVKYKGIADDESGLKNGLVRSRLSNTHTVLNHMDSLMPL